MDSCSSCTFHSAHVLYRTPTQHGVEAMTRHALTRTANAFVTRLSSVKHFFGQASCLVPNVSRITTWFSRQANCCEQRCLGGTSCSSCAPACCCPRPASAGSSGGPAAASKARFTPDGVTCGVCVSELFRMGCALCCVRRDVQICFMRRERHASRHTWRRRLHWAALSLRHWGFSRRQGGVKSFDAGVKILTRGHQI